MFFSIRCFEKSAEKKNPLTALLFCIFDLYFWICMNLLKLKIQTKRMCKSITIFVFNISMFIHCFSKKSFLIGHLLAFYVLNASLISNYPLKHLMRQRNLYFNGNKFLFLINFHFFFFLNSFLFWLFFKLLLLNKQEWNCFLFFFLHLLLNHCAPSSYVHA